MAVLGIIGCVAILFQMMTAVEGVTVTQEPVTTTVSPASDRSWYVVPAIVWSSVAAFILLVFVILAFLLFRRIRRITAKPRHKRFYNLHENELETEKHKRKDSPQFKISEIESYKRSKNSKSSKSRSKKVHRETQVHTVGRDNILVVPTPVKTSRTGSRSNRSAAESEVFNINRINPIYEYEEDEAPPKHIVTVSDAKQIGWTSIYDPGESVPAITRERRPSVRGSAAASFSGLPAPTISTSDDGVIHITYERMGNKEEHGKPRFETNNFTHIQPLVSETDIQIRSVDFANEDTRGQVVQSSNRSEGFTYVVAAPTMTDYAPYVVSTETKMEHFDFEEEEKKVLDNLHESLTAAAFRSSEPAQGRVVSSVIEIRPSIIEDSYVVPIQDNETVIKASRRSSTSSSSDSDLGIKRKESPRDNVRSSLTETRSPSVPVQSHPGSSVIEVRPPSVESSHMVFIQDNETFVKTTQRESVSSSDSGRGKKSNDNPRPVTGISSGFAKKLEYLIGYHPHPKD